MPSSPFTVIARSPAKRGDAAISQPIGRLSARGGSAFGTTSSAFIGARNDKKDNLPPLIVLAGPTASGKTDMAIALAKEFNGEIVSADSRQVYRGMRIGTAAACEPKNERTQERKNKVLQFFSSSVLPSSCIADGVPHHLLGFLEPNEPFTLADYKRLALAAIKDIHGRGRLPFLVGGTGLYIWAVVDNLQIPKVPPDAALRDSLENKTPEELLKILREFDPDAPLWIQTTNKRRLIRAIEVYLATREPFTRQRKKGPPLFRALMLGIDLPRKELYRRIDARVEWQVKSGLIRETERLLGLPVTGLPHGNPVTPAAMSGIGYREIIAYLQGKSTLAEAIQKIKYRTHGYARRQGTWFKKEKRIIWIRTTDEAQMQVQQFLRPNTDRGG